MPQPSSPPAPAARTWLSANVVYSHCSHFPSPLKRGENATGLSASPADCPISSSPPCSFLTPGTGFNPPLESASHPAYQVISSSRGYDTPWEVTYKPLRSVTTKEIWGPAAEPAEDARRVHLCGVRGLDTVGKVPSVTSDARQGHHLALLSQTPWTGTFPDRICAVLMGCYLTQYLIRAGMSGCVPSPRCALGWRL